MATTTIPGPPSGANRARASSPRRWIALTVMLVAAAMDLMGGTIATLALPSIGRALGAAPTDLEWVIAGYGLTFACALVTGGRLGDVYGRRRVFLIGVIGFSVTATICAAAPSLAWLLAARAAQGFFAALVIPQVLATVVATFPAAERAKAFAVFGATAGVSAVAGPLLGGLLLSGGTNAWRFVFLFNLPLGAAVFGLALALMPESRADTRPRLDLAGMGLLTGAMLLLLLPLVEGPQNGWTPGLLAMLIVAPPALAAFLLHQLWRERRGGSPLLPVSLLRRRSFVAGTVAAAAFFSGPPALLFVTAITMQGLGYSPMSTAVAFTPLALASVPAAAVSAPLVKRLGRRLVAGGVLLMLAGLGLLLITVTPDSATIDAAALAPGLVTAGLGLGLVAPILIDIVLTDVEPTNAGAASGALNTVMQLGGAIGIALVGLFFASTADIIGPTSEVLEAGYSRGLVYVLLALTVTAAMVPMFPTPDR